MRRSCPLAALLLAACAAAPPHALPAPAPPDGAAAGAALLQLEAAWREAWRHGDGAVVQRIEDEGFVRNGGEPGENDSRADDLGQIAARAVVYSRYENREQAVQVSGATAIISGICVMEGIAGDKPFKRELRFTDTFAWRDGAWKAVSEQLAPLEPR